jgi:hypothetical protein
MSTSIPNAWLNANQVLMCITDGTYARTPEWQDKVVTPFPLGNFTDCVVVKLTIRMVVGIELEKGLSPIM